MRKECYNAGAILAPDALEVLAYASKHRRRDASEVD